MLQETAIILIATGVMLLGLTIIDRVHEYLHKKEQQSCRHDNTEEQ